MYNRQNDITMHKKEYTTPECQVVEINTHTPLLAGSTLNLGVNPDEELEEGYGD